MALGSLPTPRAEFALPAREALEQDETVRYAITPVLKRSPQLTQAFG